MKVIFTLLISMVSLGAFAYDGWSGANKVASIRVYSDTKVYITMPGAENPKECSSPNFLMLANADTDVGKRQYSALLTAYASGKAVDLALTGCSNGGTSGYPLIEQVWLK
ncbi:hypothetical protein [uncultured Shewanella sp.]|uniref:hypothetical protein n=1 Tax=uncultured Shewanella sp. TaxID=173975 RepID=UPI00260CDFD2|nr:hypothetical protein [uncultured Shewanella sp.]